MPPAKLDRDVGMGIEALLADLADDERLRLLLPSVFRRRGAPIAFIGGSEARKIFASPGQF